MPGFRASFPLLFGQRGRGFRQRVFVGGVCLAVVVWVMLVLFTSTDFRGTDQYWYVEDVTTVLHGGSGTHEVYPFSLAGVDDRFRDSRPFIHNGPVLYVWTAAARVLDSPHRGIVAINLIGNLLAAGLIFFTVRRIASAAAGALAAVMFLFEPVSFWAALQDLSEPFSGFLIALAIYLAVRFPTRLAAIVVAEFCVAVAAAGRMWTLPFLALLPMGLMLLDAGRARVQRFGRAVFSLASGCALYLWLSHIFQSYVPTLSLMGILEMQHASRSMALWYELDAPPPFALGNALRGYLESAVTAARLELPFLGGGRGVASLLQSVAWMPGNLMAAAAAVGLMMRRNRGLARFAMFLAVGAILCQVGMAILFQNQSRYLVPVLPALVVGAAVAAHGWWVSGRKSAVVRTVAIGLLVGVFLAFGISDLRNIIAYRTDLANDTENRRTATALVGSSVPLAARVVLDTQFGERWPIDYALFPRTVLSLDTSVAYDPQAYRRLFDAFQPTFVVTDVSSVLPDLIDMRLIAQSNGWSVYAIDGVRP